MNIRTSMTIDELINKVNDLPPTPQIFQKLQSILKDEEIVLIDIFPLIKMDAPLAAQVIKISNSSYFALPEPCTSIEDAVNRIGFKEIYQIVCILTFNKVLTKGLAVYDHASGELWEYSLVCAIILESFAHLLEEDAHEAYTIGLIHALGKVIINTYFVENPTISRAAGFSGFPHEDQAHKLLGFTYADVGAALFRKWEFDGALITPIQYQFNPELATDNKVMARLLAQAKRDATNFLHAGSQTATIDPETGLTEELHKEGMHLASNRLQEIRGLMGAM